MALRPSLHGNKQSGTTMTVVPLVSSLLELLCYIVDVTLGIVQVPLYVGVVDLFPGFGDGLCRLGKLLTSVFALPGGIRGRLQSKALGILHLQAELRAVDLPLHGSSICCLNSGVLSASGASLSFRYLGAEFRRGSKLLAVFCISSICLANSGELMVLRLSASFFWNSPLLN